MSVPFRAISSQQGHFFFTFKIDQTREFADLDDLCYTHAGNNSNYNPWGQILC